MKNNNNAQLIPNTDNNSYHLVDTDIWDYTQPKGTSYMYDSINKKILQQIRDIVNQGNKVIVLIKYEKDGKDIQQYLTKENSHKNNVSPIIMSKCNNTHLLRTYSTINENNDIPDILILSYKSANIEIDLPLYNYVIHFYTSKNINELIQGFNRIYTLKNPNQLLHSIYIINPNRKSNISEAIIKYLDNINIMPNQNIFINKNTLYLIIEAYNQSKITNNKVYLVIKMLAILRLANHIAKEIINSSKYKIIDTNNLIEQYINKLFNDNLNHNMYLKNNLTKEVIRIINNQTLFKNHILDSLNNDDIEYLVKACFNPELMTQIENNTLFINTKFDEIITFGKNYPLSPNNNLLK